MTTLAYFAHSDNPADNPHSAQVAPMPPVRVATAVLNGPAEAALRQALTQRIIELTNKAEIEAFEKRAVLQWLRTQTPALDRLERQKERLEEAVAQRQGNAFRLRGVLAPAP